MIVVVDTGVANRHSVKNALEFLGAKVLVSAERSDIELAEKLVFPGVGAFGAGMKSIRSRDLEGPLTEQVIERKKPIIGLCLGYQMLFEGSEEDNVPGMGWLPGYSYRIRPNHPDLKVPHIGFNDVTFRAASPLGQLFPTSTPFYHLHSYAVRTDETIVAGTVEYGGELTAAVIAKNIWGTQFHPEKSQRPGLNLLRAFLEMN